jgi:hypothetical protein
MKMVLYNKSWDKIVESDIESDGETNYPDIIRFNEIIYHYIVTSNNCGVKSIDYIEADVVEFKDL